MEVASDTATVSIPISEHGLVRKQQRASLHRWRGADAFRIHSRTWLHLMLLTTVAETILQPTTTSLFSQVPVTTPGR